MKVDKQTIDYNQDRLNELNRLQKNIISSRENELEKLKDHYKQKVEDSKVANTVSLMDLQSINEQELVEENKQQEERLEKLKESQINLKKTLDKERELLTANQETNLLNINDQYSRKIIDVHSKGRDKELEINNQVNDLIKNFESERNESLTKLKNKNLETLVLAEADQKRQVNQIQDNLARELLQQKLDYTNKIIEQKAHHNKKVDQVTMDNTSEIEQREVSHQYNLKDQQSRHLEHLKADKNSFDEKFQFLIKAQQDAISALDEKLKSQISKLKESHSNEMRLQQNVLADPFYQITKLNPAVQEKPDHYLISVETSEHDKDKFTISVNKRKIRFNLARRFEDRLEGQNNSTFTGHRTESYTKEFFVKDILEPRDITHKWENGRLYFKIKKA